MISATTSRGRWDMGTHGLSKSKALGRKQERGEPRTCHKFKHLYTTRCLSKLAHRSWKAVHFGSSLTATPITITIRAPAPAPTRLPPHRHGARRTRVRAHAPSRSRPGGPRLGHRRGREGYTERGANARRAALECGRYNCPQQRAYPSAEGRWVKPDVHSFAMRIRMEQGPAVCKCLTYLTPGRSLRKRLGQMMELGDIMVHVPLIRRHRQRVRTCIGHARHVRNLKTSNHA